MLSLSDTELLVLTAETRSNLEGTGVRGSGLNEYDSFEIPVLPFVESLYEKLKAECMGRGLEIPTLESVNKMLESPQQLI